MPKELFQVVLTHSKDTKGTRVWTAAEGPITQLYVNRPHADTLPDKFTVVVRA